MIVLRHFSTGILNTNSPGFIHGRKYDQDLNRLGRMNTSQRELSKIGDLRKEQLSMKRELSRGIKLNDIKE